MNSKAIILSIILLASLLSPFSYANAPTEIEIGKLTVTGKGQRVPNYGYWVYGEVRNYDIHNIEQVIVEVTLYDASNNVVDTLTTLVRPTIIEAGTKAPFLVKSNTQYVVAREEMKLKSYTTTEAANFPYIIVESVSEVFKGKVTGTISNTHSYINVNEAEIIATFYNIDGDVVDIKSVGANNYAQFNAGISEDFTIQSDILTPVSVSLVTQCSIYYRESVPEISLSSDKPVDGHDLTLNFTVYPSMPGLPVDITFTSPNGDSNVVPILLYSDSSYSMKIKATVEGKWNVDMAVAPTMVNQSRGYVEGSVAEKTFTVIAAPQTGTPSENTGEDPPGIPGFPITSMVLAIILGSIWVRRRGLAYHI